MSTPATVQVWESNLVGEVPTHITGLDFGSVDEPNLVAIDHPLVIPAGGSVFAYQKWTRFKVTAWVDTNTIDNFKWFKSAGSNGANWSELFAAASNPTFATPARSAPPSSATNWPTTASSAEPVDGSFSNPSVGYSSYAVMNYSISASTASGYKGQHTVTYRYDESVWIGLLIPAMMLLFGIVA